MRWQYPWVFLLFLPLLWELFRILRPAAEPDPLSVPSAALFEGLPEGWRARLYRMLPYLRWLGLMCALLALARPQGVERQATRSAEGIDIVLALDLSSSMLAEDLAQPKARRNRLDLAKEVLRDFVGRRPNDRIGLVAFAARPYPAAPLTLDHDWLLQALAQLESGAIEDGTALGDALLAALNRLGEKGRSRIAIVLTDGRNNAGSATPEQASRAARTLGVKVYTIGVGGPGEALYPTAGPFGDTVYRRVDAEVDAVTLAEIARGTGGGFFRATDAASLSRVYRQIDLLERRPVQEKVWYRYRELFAFLLVPALFLIWLEYALRQTLLRRLG